MRVHGVLLLLVGLLLAVQERGTATLNEKNNKSVDKDKLDLEIRALEELLKHANYGRSTDQVSQTIIDNDKAEVTTQNGKVKGRVVDAPTGEEVQEYLGIPYAKPPVGNLRFQDPIPADRFPDDGYMAVDYQNSCLQPLDTTFGEFPGSNMWNAQNPLREDCLFLNVWVPQPRKEKRTVMVWIYGGGFYSGSSELWIYDGKTLASFGDVIVVSFNYRVTSFGYLSTGDGRVVGNFGMKDQVLALQWIKNNIAAFGGDPDDITLFGESAGGASIGYHMLSPLSQNLFNRAIINSASPGAHWAFMTNEEARERSQAFFEGVQCPNDDNILTCLRNLDTDTILANDWQVANFMQFPWAPVVDGDFLLDTPYNLLQAGRIAQKDTLLGANKDEGTFWLLYALPGMSKDGPSLQTRDMYLAGVDQVDWDLNTETNEEIKELYEPNDVTDQAANRDALDKVSGDRSFTCPAKALADILAEKGDKNTFFYYLTHRASNEVWPPWMGVIHGADPQWYFGMALDETKGYTDAEVDFAKDILSYWTNFAKTGDPNGDDLAEWPEYTEDEPSYLELRGPDDFVVRTGFKEDQCDMWDYIDELIHTDGMCEVVLKTC